MPGFMENVSTVNSLIRTMMALVVVGGAGFGGLFAYRALNEGDETETRLKEAEKNLEDVKAELATKSEKILQQEGEIVELNETIDEKNEVIEKQAIAMLALKTDERKAMITVLDTSGEGNEMITTIRWVELNDANQPIDEKVFELKGDMISVDAWVVKFKDEYIENADLIRGRSLYLFQRIYGEDNQGEYVYDLDGDKAPPQVYRSGETVSDFEREIWENFWEIANDPPRAEDLGIRAAHGEVVYIKEVKPGTRYEVELRASGGLSINRLEDDQPDPTAKPAA